VLLLAFAVPAPAQVPWYRGPMPDWVSDLNGTWSLNGNPAAPCRITQEWPDRRVLFTNEHGSSAWGTIRGDRVWIPDWSDGVSQGLEGRIRRDRIAWPNGSFWSR
jgi:hypothetical protein